MIRLNARLLNVVEPVLACLPRIDHRACNWVSVDVADLTGDDQGLTDPVFRDRFTEGSIRRIGHMERPEYGVLGGAIWTASVQSIDQHRHAQDIG